MPLVPFSPEKPVQSNVKLCVTCAHYIPPKLASSTRGQCRLFGMMDVIDGTITYSDVRTIREQYCKGAHFSLENPEM